MPIELTSQNQAFKDQTLIFGDGACSGNPGMGGWASIVRLTNGHIQELAGGKKLTTNNEMELTATLMGLRAVFNKPPAGPVNVFSDSVYFLRGISKWIHGWRKRGWKTAEGEDVANQSLWLELDEVVAPHRKQLRWYFVRGHEGVPGNERCDQLAVSFSLGQSQLLFTGHESKYSVDLFLLPKDMSIPENNFSSSKDKPAYSYLSALGSEVIRHKSWSECEQRVKGRSGARFKKAFSTEDETNILVSWGFKKDHPIK